MFGGNLLTDAPVFDVPNWAWAVIVVLLVWAVGATIASSMEGMWSPLSPDVTDYDCDIRSGCNTRNLTEREVTNIDLERDLLEQGGYPTYVPSEGVQNTFDLSLYQPGVDRPKISQLEIDNRLRSEELNSALDKRSNMNYQEGLTGRAESNFVFQQFGNDGTVINPAANPLYRPAKRLPLRPADEV